jgi:Class II Aldolase and Adducin N-terminal domain
MNNARHQPGHFLEYQLRHDHGLLITPTGVPYETMQPEQIVFMDLDGSFDLAQGPSREWRFHLDILKARPGINVVVHAHPPYSTILAIMGLEIPPIHYMIACAGGDSIHCARSATFGAQELSEHAERALEDRLAHHGMIAGLRCRRRCGLRLKSKRRRASTTAAFRSGRRDCCPKPRSRTFSAGSLAMVLPGKARRGRFISPQNPPRSSARR